MSAELERNPLWLILVEAVHSLPLYLSHKAYVRDSLIIQNPEISVEEISQRLDIPLGEAMVILREVRVERGVDSKGSDDGARDS
ncbi:MAG TPA: hypothetical protein VM050_09590 [Patescibacteria group bacterium]|nr:hypothetical protein [Patescibacteria group bacterium]